MLRPRAAVNLVRALPMIMASINGSHDEQSLPKSTTMTVVMATAATAYILISTFLTIMHGNYVYFERLTKIMDLLLASMHASWYTFFRNFSGRRGAWVQLTPLFC